MSIFGFITANPTFRQLLAKGVSYHVPRFQRNYSWDTKEWDELWLDIEELLEDDSATPHHMGFIVLQTDDHKSFQILDGQQRITTINLIIIAAIRHIQELVNENLDADDNAQRIELLNKSYLSYLDLETVTLSARLELNWHDNDSYQACLAAFDTAPQAKFKASGTLLQRACHHFQEKIKNRYGYTEDSGRQVARFINTLANKLSFIAVTVPDELSAAQVLEAQNARNVRLSKSDLLKNHIFRIINLPNMPEAELRLWEKKWMHISDMLEGEDFADLLLSYWNSKHDPTRGKDIFKAVRQNITDQHQARELLTDLEQLAEAYVARPEPQRS